MILGGLFPAALTAWRPRRATRPADAQVGRPPASFTPAAAPVLPRGVVAIEPETQSALTAASDFARGRFVELQMAVEPHLIAQADAAEYQKCLEHLIHRAIGRASSGVLVTAMRQADGVEIAVLDDGADPGGDPGNCSVPPAEEPPVPVGGLLSASYQAELGTTVMLRLPQPDWLPFQSDADAADGIWVSAEL